MRIGERAIDHAGMLAWAPPIVRRIATAVRRGVERGHAPDRLYLSDSDWDELRRAQGQLDERGLFGGLRLRRGKRSMIYCTSAVGIAIPARPPP